MKYPEGSIIINKQGERRKVLGACGEVRFVSPPETFEKVRHEDSMRSVRGLEDDGYTEEAPRWEPKFPFWFVTSYGDVECSRGQCNDENDTDLLKSYASFGNCFPTRELAEAARERVKKALRGE